MAGGGGKRRKREEEERGEGGRRESWEMGNGGDGDGYVFFRPTTTFLISLHKQERKNGAAVIKHACTSNGRSERQGMGRRRREGKGWDGWDGNRSFSPGQQRATKRRDQLQHQPADDGQASKSSKRAEGNNRIKTPKPQPSRGHGPVRDSPRHITCR